MNQFIHSLWWSWFRYNWRKITEKLNRIDTIINTNNNLDTYLWVTSYASCTILFKIAFKFEWKFTILSTFLEGKHNISTKLHTVKKKHEFGHNSLKILNRYLTTDWKYFFEFTNKMFAKQKRNNKITIILYLIFVFI